MRQIAEPAIQAVTMLAAQTSQDFDDMLGVYPASWGEQGNEKSGVAIQQRRSAGSLGSSHFSLNAGRARKRKAQLLVDLIPLVYWEPDRVVRILGEEMEQELIQLQAGRGTPQTQTIPGQQLADGTQVPEQRLPEGIAGLYDVTAGRYDVILQSGPSQVSKQEETATFLTELAQVAPQVGQLGADILVTAHGNFDRQDELARRLKRSLPPQVLDPEDQSKPEDQVILLQQQMAQADPTDGTDAADAPTTGPAGAAGRAGEREAEAATHRRSIGLSIDYATLAAQRELDAAKLALERERFAFEQQKWMQEQEWRRYEAERQAQQEAEGTETKEEVAA